jgi:translation initiation factor 3 subunit K
VQEHRRLFGALVVPRADPSYQFNPQLSNPDVILNLLIKALSATVHGPDFNLCLALLREPAAIVQDIDSDDESLTIAMPFLQGLHDLVRGCQFTKFWAEFNGSSEAAQRECEGGARAASPPN